MTAFSNNALVTKERMASPLNFIPVFPEFWTPLPSDRVFGSRTDAFSIQFPDFSTCHLMYHKVVQHATAFALDNQKATATFMLLPNWTESGTNSNHKIALPGIRMFICSIPEKFTHTSEASYFEGVTSRGDCKLPTRE